MPTISPDWEVIRQVAVQVGLREAARQFGLSEDMVCKRSYREGWLKTETIKPEASAVIERVIEQKGLSTAVHTKGSDVLFRLAERTKMRMARGIDKGANAIRKLDGDRILDKADKVKALVDSASKLHGWGQDSEKSGTLVNINLLGVDPGSVQ